MGVDTVSTGGREPDDIMSNRGPFRAYFFRSPCLIEFRAILFPTSDELSLSPLPENSVHLFFCQVRIMILSKGGHVSGLIHHYMRNLAIVCEGG